MTNLEVRLFDRPFTVRPIAVHGLGLQCTGVGELGPIVVMEHNAVDRNAFWQAWAALGGDRLNLQWESGKPFSPILATAVSAPAGASISVWPILAIAGSILAVAAFFMTIVTSMEPAGSNLVTAGEVGVFWMRDGSPIAVGADIHAWRRLDQLASVGDSRGMANMQVAGQAALIESGTKGLCLGHAGKYRESLCEVRILEGRLKGESVVIENRFFVPLE